MGPGALGSVSTCSFRFLGPPQAAAPTSPLTRRFFPIDYHRPPTARSAVGVRAWGRRGCGSPFEFWPCSLPAEWGRGPTWNTLEGLSRPSSPWLEA